MCKKVIGLAMFSMGCGMFMVLIIPGWAYILAACFTGYGFWWLYCN